MLAKSIKDNSIVVGAFDQCLISKSEREESMDANIMATKLKYKVDELSSLSASSSKRINELKISVASAKKVANTNTRKHGSLANK